MQDNILQAKLHFIAGKGGVGKTLISQALATHFSESFDTLLVELGEEEGTEEAPKLSPIKEVSPKLSHIKIFPDQALYEYLKLKIPKRVIDSLLSKSLFRTMCSAMPGLADLTRLGKIWYHTRDFQKIVVDMPSSGFVSRFLSVASVVSDAVKIGPLAKEARLIHEYLRDPKLARVHLASMPKELIINETFELYQQLKKKPSAQLGFILLNRVLDLDLKELPEDLSQYPEISSVIEIFRKRKIEEDQERCRLIQLGISLPQLVFFDQVGEMMDSKIVSSMVKTIGVSTHERF